MKRNHAFTILSLFCLLVSVTSTQLHATTVHLTSAGPSPVSLQVKIGSSIGFTGVPRGEAYGVTMTSAPNASGFTLGTESEFLSGCLDFGFIPAVAGTYTYRISYDACTYTGTVIATSSDTTYIVPGGVVSSFVNVGDVIIFYADPVKYCAAQVYPFLTSVPEGASNPIPSGTGYAYDINASGHGPLVYPVTVAGTYRYQFNTGAGDTGSFTAMAASSVGTSGQQSGFSMRVTPEPSNGIATIALSGERPADLHLALFDATGRQIRQYDEMKFGAGEASIPLSSTELPSGNYYLRAAAGQATVAMTKVLIVH